VAPEIAEEAVDLIGDLFRMERRAKDLSVEQRLALRRAESAPVLAKLREKLLGWKEQLLPKHPMAEAINYALNQWAELNVFCSDGAVPIDNNVFELEMKRIILNRNYVQLWIMRSAALKSEIVSFFVGRSALTAMMN
jgi:transposase